MDFSSASTVPLLGSSASASAIPLLGSSASASTVSLLGSSASASASTVPLLGSSASASTVPLLGSSASASTVPLLGSSASASASSSLPPPIPENNDEQRLADPPFLVDPRSSDEIIEESATDRLQRDHRIRFGHPPSPPPAKQPVNVDHPAAFVAPRSYNILFITCAIIAYFFASVMTYYAYHEEYTTGEDDKSSSPVVDAIYFSMVTFCTIGYGDITPKTRRTRILTCLFATIGILLWDTLLNDIIDYLLDAMDRVRGRQPTPISIWSKVGFATAAALISIGVGTAALHFFEKLHWGDALYLSVITVTTVGYGEKSFKTSGGRVFASFWLLLSTMAVAKTVMFLTEARANMWCRTVTKPAFFTRQARV